MTGAQFIAALQKVGGVASDVFAAYEAGGADLSADLTVAEDVVALIAPFVPGVSIAEELLPALGLLVPALSLIHLQGGVNANFGPGNGDPLGIQTGR